MHVINRFIHELNANLLNILAEMKGGQKTLFPSKTLQTPETLRKP